MPFALHQVLVIVSILYSGESLRAGLWSKLLSKPEFILLSSIGRPKSVSYESLCVYSIVCCFGKVLISTETWSKCAFCQIVSRDRFFHSRKCSIGVFSSLEVSILFPSIALSEPTVYEQLSRRNAILT
ncbi:unnamed protein product [Lactuca virosa]|uniref:Secreted protein n=1 Tax=Lactuca virosa TaxID=75947 RepID=A0AAU9PQ48_9ASTR|nr:unnamed protein product [Lactuca virosa]